MSFPSPLTSPELVTLRTSGYWSRVFACLNPNEIVWQAQASQTITSNPFITFTWDTETVGSWEDVWEGLVCYISETTDLTDVKYRGRVRLAPSSTEFDINLNSTILNDGDYITVIADADLFARIRNDTLVDGSIAYHDLPPMLSGLPSAIVLYDEDNDGQVTYTPDQTGIPVDAAATSIDDWAWSALGSGTFSIDDPTLEHPTFTFEAGYHYLIRVIYIDDNGTSNYQISHVYAITRTFDAPVVQPIVTGAIDGEDGWTASLTAYGDVTGLLDRTHCAIFHVQHFGDDSDSPIVSNVLMNGRIRSSSIQTEGSSEAGQLQQVSFTVEGITAYLRRLRLPNDIIRATASPDEWGEIIAPTPYRMAVYAMWVYSTLTNIASLGVEGGAFAAWQIGGEPRAIDGGYAIDVLKSVLDPIHAAPNYAPDGEVYLAQNVNYKADRSGVPLITAFTQSDMTDYRVDLDSSSVVSQVIAYGGVYDSAANDFVLYSAQAPSIVYLEGEIRELNREILAVDSTVDEAREELGLRASNHYADENSKPLMSLTLIDSYAGVVIPTNFQRWAAVLTASSNTLGRAWSATDYWLLQSISLTINTDGSIDVSGQWPAETSFDDAQTLSALLPINLEDMNPVLPVLPNDLAFPTDPLENYPTDTPALNERSPTDPFSGMMAYTPLPPDVAAQAAAAQSRPGCQTIPILFRQSTNTQSARVTTLGADYLMSVEGTTVYSTDEWTYTGDFTTSDEGFAPEPTVEYGVWTDGVGWETTDAFHTGFYRRSVNILRTLATDATYIAFVYDWTAGGTWDDPRAVAIEVNGSSLLLYDAAHTDLANGTNKTASWSGTQTITDVNFLTNSSVALSASYSGFALQKSFTMRGTGTNPFTGGSVTPLRCDAFYVYDPENEAVPAAQLSGTEGLFVDNVKVLPPPYNKNHRYTNIPYTGTNNFVLARMAFDNYDAKSNLSAFLEVCPKD